MDALSEDTKGIQYITEIKNHKALFKIDTGADVTAIPATLYTLRVISVNLKVL